MTERQSICLNELERIGAWLQGTRRACEDLGTDCTRLACLSGIQDLQAVLKVIDGEITPERYKAYRAASALILEAMKGTLRGGSRSGHSRQKKKRRTKMIETGEIMALIPTGKRHAIDGASLAARVNLTEDELRRVIAKARASGEPICSDVFGYYRPENKEEMEEYRRRVFRNINYAIVANAAKGGG